MITSRENSGNGQNNQNGSAVMGGNQNDNSDLFLEEKETELARKAELEREKASNVPGMLKP